MKHPKYLHLRLLCALSLCMFFAVPGVASALRPPKDAPDEAPYDAALSALMDQFEAELLTLIKDSPEYKALGDSPTRVLTNINFQWTCETRPNPELNVMAFKFAGDSLRLLAIASETERNPLGNPFAPSGFMDTFYYPVGKIRAGKCTSLPWLSPDEINELPEDLRAVIYENVYKDSGANLCSIIQRPERERGPGGIWVLQVSGFAGYWKSDKGRLWVLASVERDEKDDTSLVLSNPKFMPVTDEALGSKWIFSNPDGSVRCDDAQQCANLSNFAKPKQKLAFLEKACDLSDSVSCFWMGRLLAEGSDGLPADKAKSDAAYLRTFTLNKTKCDEKDGNGCFLAGVQNEQGEGIPQNPKEAVNFYALSCSYKDANGCFNLAGMHLRGLGTPQSDPEALAAYTLACDLSDTEACDRAQAIRECSSGDTDACAFLTKVGRPETPTPTSPRP